MRKPAYDSYPRQAICFGVESGSQEILDLARKKSDLQKVRGAMRMAQAAGINSTQGATPAVIQEVADTYEETLERYLQYQHWLYANDRLEGYENKVYLQRRRQSLLWKLLLDDVIEGLPAFRRDPLAELKSAVVEATGAPPGYVGAELERVLALGALVRREAPEGTCFAWSE